MNFDISKEIEDTFRCIKTQILKYFDQIERCGAERIIKVITQWNPVETRGRVELVVG